jgi:hypothetical protein
MFRFRFVDSYILSSLFSILRLGLDVRHSRKLSLLLVFEGA